jgi:hypothetical protein
MGSGNETPDLRYCARSQQQQRDAIGAGPAAAPQLIRWSSASVEAEAFPDYDAAAVVTAMPAPPSSGTGQHTPGRHPSLR